jgi:hypothetical protein
MDLKMRTIERLLDAPVATESVLNEERLDRTLTRQQIERMNK